MKSTIIGVLLALVLAGTAAAAPNAPGATLATITHALVGTWQGDQDTGFTREFLADGTVIDRHESDASATAKGTWVLFAGSAPPEPVRHKLTANAAYLELKVQGDVFLFELVGIDHQSLQLVYLERGNLLAFSRLK